MRIEDRVNNYIVYVGVCKTQSTTSGIYAGVFSAETNQIGQLKQLNTLINVRAIRVSGEKGIVYTVIYNGDGCSEIIAYKINENIYELQEINRLGFSAVGISYLNLDKTERFLLMADYVSGKVIMITTNEDGSIGEFSGEWMHSGKSINSQRQNEPHPHSIYTDLDNNYVVVPDLGTDELVLYKLNYKDKILEPHNKLLGALGSGPRHFAFHPSNKYAYLLSELDMRLTAYSYNASRGSLEEIHSVDILPDGLDEDSYGGDIQISSDGALVFASMRANKRSVSVFSVDIDSGRLSFVTNTKGHGSMRDIKISRRGEFVFGLNEEGFGLSGGVEVFRYDKVEKKLISLPFVEKLPHAFCIDIYTIDIT